MRSSAAEFSRATAPEAPFATVISIALVAIAGVWSLLAFRLGPLATHMAVHIAAMNIVAPVLALAIGRHSKTVTATGLWLASALQLMALAGWHAMPTPHGDHTPGWIAAAALLVISTGFWIAVFNCTSRWHALAALLLTGKLVCLFGALLVFAPSAIVEMHGTNEDFALADQQLAGLLMITACPLSYITCALVFVARVLDSPRPAT